MPDDNTSDDRPSSIAAEQVEDLARKNLEAYPDLANIEFDFGEMPDGTIDIWVGGVQYNDVEDIVDVRVRKAIADAVAQFNK
jgi:hypothetical protein